LALAPVRTAFLLGTAFFAGFLAVFLAWAAFLTASVAAISGAHPYFPFFNHMAFQTLLA
jgi:hypothetical protein